MLLSLLFSLSLSAPQPALLAADVPLRVTRRSGEVLEGTTTLSSFEIDTDFGSAEVELEQVVWIQFGEPDRVLTRGGVELTGALELARVRLTTEDGRESLRSAELERVDVLHADAPSAAGGFSGRWMTLYGPMELELQGAEVVGTYADDGSGRLRGEQEGGVLEFRFESGSGRFELWSDGQGFSGSYETDSGETGLWCGYRREPVAAPQRAGEVTRGQSESGLNYHLWTPEEIEGVSERPAIVLLHGSNMSASAYVHTFVATWPEIAAQHRIVGFDGEEMNNTDDPDEATYNYTYINFSGPEVGPAFMHTQSPALVAAALEQLGGELGVTDWLVGGHSQGGYLTYAIAQFYPELVSGAFPISAGFLVQCEPDYAYFRERPEHVLQQHQVPFAIVHGSNDPLVDFSNATYAHERLVDGGYPAVRLFEHERAAHMFGLLPVGEAVRWLIDMSSSDGERLGQLADAELEAERFRSAAAAAARARTLELSGANRRRLDSIERVLESEASELAASLLDEMEGDQPSSWVGAFWEFREQHGLSEAAAPVLRAYQDLREAQQERGDELFYEARGERDAGRREELYRAILEQAFATKWWPVATRFLEE